MFPHPQNQPAVYYDIIDIAPDDAPWLTMVHGFSHNHAYFSAHVARFQADYRILRIDFRGHGGSSKMPGPYGLEEYADDVLAALDAAGVEQTHYWGTHTGSGVGLLLACRQPERLLSLVLESAVLPGFDMPRVTELLARARSIAQTEGVEAAKRDWVDRADWFEGIRANPDRCRAAEHRALVDQFEGAPWLSALAPRPVMPVADHMRDINIVTLLYNGEHDLPDFKRVASILEANLPRVRRCEIPGAGGFAGWERPEMVNDLVHGFLKDTGGYLP